ncbi:hypothetical protein LX81_03808 [Palleronia aestuarii]|uniref:Uncharacterized protein n=1 Tax=Palleronia aestuarii TaxID=568105 RepID=A0A2W7PR11_9RHOB|nr:hypothetical protein [Palleronia aestuarii]PZX11839.1 hypothetical protein LX81_03808 [Palleronia aestuarii]
MSRHVLDQSGSRVTTRSLARCYALDRMARAGELSRRLVRLDRAAPVRPARRLPRFLRIARGIEA